MQKVLDFCGHHNLTSDIELIPIQEINEASERLVKSDVKYRRAIDRASLKEPRVMAELIHRKTRPMKPRPFRPEKGLGKALKTFRQLPARTWELAIHPHPAERSTNPAAVGLHEVSREETRLTFLLPLLPAFSLRKIRLPGAAGVPTHSTSPCI
jgi:hypothetical protein